MFTYFENDDNIINKIYLRGRTMSTMVVFSFINIIIILALLGIGIYGFVLFIKLAKRGIKALDIYIEEKSNNKLK